MRAQTKSFFVPAVLAGALLTSAFAIGPAMADMPADGLAQLDKGAVEFVALLKDPASKASPPRLTDERVKPIFAKLLDKQKILGTAPYKAKDVQPLLGIFSGYFALTKAYMEFKDPAGKQSVADNDVTYQDELTRLADAMLDTSAALSGALNDSVATAPDAELTEARKSELAKLRSGISQMFTGALTILENPRYSKENKAILAASLAKNGESYRDIIAVAERTNIVKAAMGAMLQTPREVEADMNTFINALKSEECTGICALK